jgi:hypothetical protein
MPSSEFALRRINGHTWLTWNYFPLRKFGVGFVIFLALWILPGFAAASNHYTAKHINAFAARVGRTFWIKSADGKLPSFHTAPAAGATTFRGEDRQSFEIIELTGRANKNPYYKVKFSLGKEGYISPETFHEELNLTILTAYPYAEEKRRAGEVAKEEEGRIEWIQSQPWSPAVKQAAIKKQPVPGLTTGEIKKVLGEPNRVVKIRGPFMVSEERWYYPDGKVLTFHNELLSTVDQQKNK